MNNQETRTAVVTGCICDEQYEYLLIFAADTLRIYRVERTGILDFIGSVSHAGQFSVYREKITIETSVLVSAHRHLKAWCAP